MGDNSITAVQVALRIRPLIPTEIKNGQQQILETISNEPQVLIRSADKAFTFNYVFDSTVTQEEVYTKAVKNMIGSLFKGYNVTILAYGQTGSGKTHTMGTSYSGNEEDMGVIQRAIDDIFKEINLDTEHEYQVTVSFMELYQELLFDLLANKPRDQCVVDIREDSRGGICVPGLTERIVCSVSETYDCLIQGSQGRATGATAMNAQSSRSHAIFTVTIKKESKNDSNVGTTAKFHLVDLAGSERSKKTKTSGERFKEGVKINQGLLALGNVISALGEENVTYISYRDSKLTRLLQDSLGGNSITLMIACVSPAGYNLDETISTLRYADRAKKIKNKPIVNQDPQAAEIIRLRQQVKQLQLQLLEQNVGTNSSDNDLRNELLKLRQENELLQIKNRKLTEQLHVAIAENAYIIERSIITDDARDKMQKKLEELNEIYNETLVKLNLSAKQVELCSGIQGKIEDIQKEYQTFQKEVLGHDVMTSVTEHKTNPEIIINNDVDEVRNQYQEQYQESHVMRQLAYSSQLQELMRNIVIKEQLASEYQIKSNEQLLEEKLMKEDQSKISALEREKDELLQQLKNVQTSNINSKLAEQRRHRVQELEAQITDLNRKLREQARILKMRERDEIKIKQLNNEIMSMKQMKVKLVKTMRSEADKFRQWKTQRERELSRLREQDRKRQNKMIQMENMHLKQQTVLKRKVEEAAAINKRLKDALQLQKAAQDRRVALNGKVERIQQWVAQELEVLVSTIEAERTLEQLIDEKKLIESEREKLLHGSSDSLTADDDLKQQRIREIDDDLELRTEQINDMRQKIQDSDQENKAKTRWDLVQSMAEAKCALKYLFELAADIRKKELTSKMKDREQIDELKSKNEQLKQQLMDLLVKQEHEISESGTYCHLDQISELTAELNKYKEKCVQLELATSKIKSKKRRQTMFQVDEEDANTDKLEVPTITDELENSFDEDKTYDDDMNDPDWCKTPIVRRVKQMRRSKMSVLGNANDTTSNEQKNKSNLATKRTVDGMSRCFCTTSCSTKRCSCFKLNNICTALCKCSDRCTNNIEKENKSKDNLSGTEKTNETENSTNTSDEDLIENDKENTPVSSHLNSDTAFDPSKTYVAKKPRQFFD